MNVAKVFMSGRSQAVRLPKEFRFKSAEVTIKRVPGGLLLSEENVWDTCRAACEELDIKTLASLGTRVQPPTQKRDFY